MPKLKTQQDLFDDLTLIEKIDAILAAYNIPKKEPFPFTQSVGLIAWECKVSISDVERELEKMFVDPLNN